MPITILQIAQLCGVSRGTVDRALNNKGNVRPEVCERIKRVAAEHGYQPNRAGQALARAHRPLRIGVVLHSVQTPFVQILQRHFLRTGEEVEPLGTKVFVRSFEGVSAEALLAQIDELIEKEKVEGIVIMPLAYKSIQDKINDLVDRKHIPVIIVNCDLPSSRRMCYVGQNNVAAGRAAAGLIGLVVRRPGSKILPITGQMTGHVAYTERLFGFTQELDLQFPDLSLLPVENCMDDPENAYQIVCTALKTHPDLGGIYVSSTGYGGVCKALIESNMQHKVHVVVHDMIPENLQMARLEVYDFVIGQDARTQGSLPITLLQEKLLSNTAPERELFHTAIEVRFRYNITEADMNDG